VVDVDRGLIRVGADVEVHRQAHRAGIGARRAHVDHAVHAVDLLLDRRGDRLGDRLGAGAGVARLHHHLGRHDGRVLLDRKRVHRREPGEHDDDRQDRRENRPVDEEAGDHRPPPLPVASFARAPSSAGWPSRTSTPARTLPIPPTTIRSPGFSPSSITWPSSVEAPRLTGRAWARPFSPTTQTGGPGGPSTTAREGTTMASGTTSPSTEIRTNWPGTSMPSGLGKTARAWTVPVWSSTFAATKSI